MFFYKICKSIFYYLLRFKSNIHSLFDFFSIYFKIIKTNGQDILYIHCFFGLKQISGFTDIEKRIIEKEKF